MSQDREGHIRPQMTRLISPQLIRAQTRQLGVVKRQRKVDVVALVYTLVLGFDSGPRRSLAGLRRAYTMATGTTLPRRAAESAAPARAPAPAPAPEGAIPRR